MDDCYFTPVSDTECFTEDLNFLDPEDTERERHLFWEWFYSLIQFYGTGIDYMQNNYDMDEHNPIYGEHNTKVYSDPVYMKAMVMFNSDITMLNTFGYDTDGDITAFVHLSAFEAEFGEGEEPLPGDLIKMTDYGSTGRKNGRDAAIFEITRRDDEELDTINPLLGHYVWMIRAKRYDYSYENNVEPEKVMNQVNDDITTVPLLSSTTLSGATEDTDKLYDGSADELGELIFNYDTHSKSNDSVYGDY